MYDYVKRTYGVNPQVGQWVRHKVTKKLGMVATEDLSASHYVYVKFDADLSGVALPCHPTELRYFEGFLIDRVKRVAEAAGVSTARPDSGTRQRGHYGQNIGYHCSFARYLIDKIEQKLGISTTGNLYERTQQCEDRLLVGGERRTARVA